MSQLPRNWVRLSGETPIKKSERDKLSILKSSETQKRFYNYVNKTKTCWLWTGPSSGKGYGDFYCAGSKMKAHRYTWTVANNRIIPKGGMICHKCDTPLCVNPDHLFLGDAKINQLDCAAKGRHWCIKKTHCKNGHRFTVENTLFFGPEGKWRQCKTCQRKADRKYKDFLIEQRAQVNNG